jgi:pimeloyl-ACP methyl ester carboxylesterase
MKRIASACVPALALAIFLLAAAAAQAEAPQDGYARLDKARIHYLNQGQGPDAVVFLHGWNCDASFWLAQMAAVGQERRVVAVDLLGFGKSDAPEAEYTQDLLARSLAAVLDAAGVRRAVLVGHSMGLAVAKRYIETHPGRVVGLFIVDGAYMDLPKDAPRAHAMLKTLAAPETQTPAGWHKFVTGFVTPMFSASTPPEVREKVMATMLGSPRHVGLSALRNFLLPGAWSPAPLALPVRAVYAGKLMRGDGVQDYLACVFPQLAYEEWEDTGHLIMFDQAERLNGAVALFSAQVLP